MYYFNLKNIPHPLTPKGEEWLFTLPTECHVELPRRFISHIYEDWISSLGLIVWNGEVFCRPKNSMLGIHIDGAKIYDKGKMNWAWCDGEHFNTWYKVRDGVDKQPIRELQTDGKISDYFYNYSLDEVVEDARTTLKNPTVISSGVPHSVITTTHTRRSVSITLIPKNHKFEDPDWGIPMAKLQEILKDYVDD